jgi:hypothetical protein
MNEKPVTKPAPIRNARGQLLPGVILNPKGRTKGAWGARKRAFQYLEEIAERACREAQPQSADA